jgi:hypothetical protein
MYLPREAEQGSMIEQTLDLDETKVFLAKQQRGRQLKR